jgi:hypothetical protein
VYGSTTCSTTYASLGTDSGPTDAEGPCHTSSFTLSGSLLTYENSWTVKRAPSAAASAVVGIVVGVVVGVVVLGCIAAALHRQRAVKGGAQMTFMGGSGGGGGGGGGTAGGHGPNVQPQYAPGRCRQVGSGSE